ncbi:atrial natriuretic peptide receptor 1 [Aplysia californica]|uniref:Guanylate cyclase n=1 Tax=Aplysia californica TaxID=6500 RepID=A0ABM1W198_APLCA|nr:atrial natriuretic peptide receptor 1 [Aplysia californica]
MWNRTFIGISGTVSIDANGDRNADYSLLDMDPATSTFRVVANYYGNRKQYEPVKGVDIHWAGGRTEPPPDTPTCGFDGSKCPPDEPFPLYVIVIIVLGSIIIVVLIISFFVYRHVRLEAELAEMNWRVRWDDILFGSPGKNKKLERQESRMSLNRKNSYNSSCSGDTIAAHLNDGNRQLFTKTGYYKVIGRTQCNSPPPPLPSTPKIKDLQNDHIVRFVGACIDPPHQCIITEYCPKGSLQDVLENEEIKLDWMFRYSIMQDIVRGMTYLHSSEVKSHGNLKSTNCVVDSRFVVKITDFGLHHLRRPEDEAAEESFASFQRMLWTAPELLRMTNRPREGTQKGDVYSFAIICQEIVYRNGVFHLQNLDVSPQEPVPRSVAGQLIRGESVMAETYESVTIYFSDICGFTALSAESTAMQVVDLLNDLYTAFDTIVGRFDVYKVETIGDAYMVVSGLPVRNGVLHAREIARMSLALLKAIHNIKVRHKPDYQLKLRIGIHSGSVCAGVVGLKMPRYCLFGDTVNTSSRMESNGEPLKIHVTNPIYLSLLGPQGKGKVTTYWLQGEEAPSNMPLTSHGIL